MGLRVLEPNLNFSERKLERCLWQLGARLDALVDKSTRNGARGCTIRLGKDRFAPWSPGSTSRFETTSNNSRIGRPTRNWHAGVEQLDQHRAIGKDPPPFGWQGASARMVNMKSPT